MPPPLLQQPSLTPDDAANTLAHHDAPGLYAISVISPNTLPTPFSTELLRRSTTLIYIGKATRSLLTRWYHQEYLHKSPGTFFRSIGATLGHTPPPGSLIAHKNKRNFRFSPTDTAAITNWLHENTRVQLLRASPDQPAPNDTPLIKAHTPLLNIASNPHPFPPLRNLRAHCQTIATTQD